SGETEVGVCGKINPGGVAMAWYNPDATGPGNYNLGGDGKGKYVYLNGGQRFVTGHLPTNKQKFFDASGSQMPLAPARAPEPTFPNYRCVGCPSSGATDIVPAAQAS